MGAVRVGELPASGRRQDLLRRQRIPHYHPCQGGGLCASVSRMRNLMSMAMVLPAVAAATATSAEFFVGYGVVSAVASASGAVVYSGARMCAWCVCVCVILCVCVCVCVCMILR